MKQQPNTKLYIGGESTDINSESLNINYYTTEIESKGQRRVKKKTEQIK